MIKSTILVPDYIQNFRCIGNKCEDNCCKEWKITVDKKSYNYYKNVGNSAIKPKLQKYIKRNRQSKSDSQYGKIELVDRKCPMLSNEGLCDIYLHLGEEAMCHTCTVYPRIYNLVDGSYEKSLVVSCPEVARQALLKKDGIEFYFLEEDTSKISISNSINTTVPKNILTNNFWELRKFSIEIIQDRRFSIEDRMILLGMFFNHIDKNKDVENIVLDSIAYYKRNIDEGNYKNLSQQLGLDYHINTQLALLSEINNQLTSLGINKAAYLKYLNNLREGLNIGLGNNDEIIENYTKAMNNHYKPFMNDHSYVLENYLVNYMFKILFPYSEKQTPLDVYMDLAMQFSLLKMHLIGISSYYKENLNLDDALGLIYSFSFVTEHKASLIPTLHQYIAENNLNSLAHMIILIGK